MKADCTNPLYSECPVCGNNMMTGMSDNVKKAIHMIGLISEHVNPGGRELILKGNKRVQLSDMCSICDEKKIWSFIKENYPELFDKIT